ncbi:hypothetical protein Taro_044511 [Colocasia esculenta]|uniref:Uncharacterized protein n=1 Tax=Colocasia esculenta TaxID=4460 RepID=A0A843WUS1_COLES|nr:hypothetical protein [Colocasia esculenta]
MFPRTVCCCSGEGFSQDCFVLVSAVAVLPQSLRCAVGLAGAFWRVFPRAVPWWFWWRFSQDRLALLLQFCLLQLCILVKVLPRIALCRFWRRFFPGVLCVCFGPPLCCPCGLRCSVGLGCILVRFSQDGSWRFLWRFSPKLLRVVLMSCRCLPVGLSVLQSTWALSVEGLCPWPCVWLPRWPACLVSHFQVSWPRWRDLCVPVA